MNLGLNLSGAKNLDLLGIGALGQGQGEAAKAKWDARSVEGCGVRPTCLFGSNCNERKKSFDDCLKANQDLRAMEIANQGRAIDANSKSSNVQSSNMKWIYVIVGVIVVILIIKLIK